MLIHTYVVESEVWSMKLIIIICLMDFRHHGGAISSGWLAVNLSRKLHCIKQSDVMQDWFWQLSLHHVCDPIASSHSYYQQFAFLFFIRVLMMLCFHIPLLPWGENVTWVPADCGGLKCDRLWSRLLKGTSGEFGGKSWWEVPNWDSLFWIRAVEGKPGTKYVMCMWAEFTLNERS